MGQQSQEKEGGQLTPLELRVVSAIVAGHTNPEIALKFSFSEADVERHVLKIFDKLGVVNRLELVLHAIDSGLIKQSAERWV